MRTGLVPAATSFYLYNGAETITISDSPTVHLSQLLSRILSPQCAIWTTFIKVRSYLTRTSSYNHCEFMTFALRTSILGLSSHLNIQVVEGTRKSIFSFNTEQSARVVTGIRTQTASLIEASFPVRRLLRPYLIYRFIKHGWFGPHHDHGLRIHRASRQLSSTSAPLARVFTHGSWRWDSNPRSLRNRLQIYPR